ncbi:MAG: hypothetical protein KDI13_07665 [Alphaproteobacteria bacterium]|nr:hypothetical protein [Alphaproteobacteria bacterium]
MSARVSFLVFLVSGLFVFSHTVVYAQTASCPVRSEDTHVRSQEIIDYYNSLDIVFRGIPVRSGGGMFGFEETVFEVTSRYKGVDQKEVAVTHSPGKYSRQEGQEVLVRAKHGDDGVLYSDPINCPDYYNDEEIMGMAVKWPRLIPAVIILALSLFLAYKIFLRERNKVSRRKA